MDSCSEGNLVSGISTRQIPTMDEDEIGRSIRTEGRNERHTSHEISGGEVLPPIVVKLTGASKSAGLDLGGSLAKVVYLEQLESSPAVKSSPEGHLEERDWRFKFIKFEAQNLCTCLDFIR